MTNKFNWITSDLEFTKLLAYYDNTIADIQAGRIPKPWNDPMVQDVYTRYINDRDELLDQAIALKLVNLS